MATETPFTGAPRRVTIGPVTKQSSTGRIVFPLSIVLSGELLGDLPDWVSDGFDAVTKGFTEVEPEVQQIADIMLCFTNDKPKSSLFKNPDAKAPTSELRNFKITRTGDPDEPEVELQFKAFCAFSRELWQWLGEMCGEECFMNFPTALAQTPERPAEASGTLPLAEPSERVDGAPVEAGKHFTEPSGKSGPKKLAAFHAKVQ